MTDNPTKEQMDAIKGWREFDSDEQYVMYLLTTLDSRDQLIAELRAENERQDAKLQKWPKFQDGEPVSQMTHDILFQQEIAANSRCEELVAELSALRESNAQKDREISEWKESLESLTAHHDDCLNEKNAALFHVVALKQQLAEMTEGRSKVMDELIAGLKHVLMCADGPASCEACNEVVNEVSKAMALRQKRDE